MRITVQDLEAVADAGDPRGLELRLVGTGINAGQSVSTPRFPPGVPLGLTPGVYRLGNSLLLVRPLRGVDALLIAATDRQGLNEARGAFARALAVLVPAALLLSLLVGWAVAGRLLRPVSALETAARSIGEGGDLRQPLPGAGPGDELARLAAALEQSFHRLADARDREQAFLRAAAHDLRSPLAALRARVDGTLAAERDPARYQHELRELGHDLTRLSDLTNHLLLLAREPSALQRAPVALRDLAAEAVDRAREADQAGTDIDLQAPQPLTVWGDRVLLGQAIWNLTANALRHAPGATVTVTVGLSPEPGPPVAQVRVADTGPGVSPEVLGKLGEAFYRPSESRSGEGYGLGLALARRAAELHGGRLTLLSEPGQGFTALLEVPLSVPDP